jgi:hypothetical protein
VSGAQRIIPFLVPPRDAVVCQPWMMKEPRQEGLASVFPEWDSATDLKLSRSVHLDSQRIWTSCSLATDDRIAVIAEWTSEGTSLRGTSTTEAVGYGDGGDLTIGLQAPGAELGQALLLKTRLILLPGKGKSESRLAPRLPGSILWQDEFRVALEGEGSRFPMETIDFEQLSGGVPRGASWHLHWMPHEPELPLSAAVRLYLNSRRETIIQAVVVPMPSAAQQTVRRVILWDVGRRLVKGMLENPEFKGDKGGYAPGSLGQAVTSLIELHLHGDTVEGLRSLQKAQPDLFETLLQSAFDPLKEESP